MYRISQSYIRYRKTSQPRGFLLCAYHLYLNLQSALIEAIITTGKVLVSTLEQSSRLLFSMTSLCSSVRSKKRTICASEVIQIDEISPASSQSLDPCLVNCCFLSVLSISSPLLLNSCISP